MEKHSYALMTLVVLCVLPIYCEPRSVKQHTNYEVDQAADDFKTKKIQSNTKDKVVPVLKNLKPKQKQQHEKPIKTTIKPNKIINKFQSNVQRRGMKSRNIYSTTLVPKKRKNYNPQIDLRKIKAPMKFISPKAANKDSEGVLKNHKKPNTIEKPKGRARNKFDKIMDTDSKRGVRQDDDTEYNSDEDDEPFLQHTNLSEDIDERIEDDSLGEDDEEGARITSYNRNGNYDGDSDLDDGSKSDYDFLQPLSKKGSSNKANNDDVCEEDVTEQTLEKPDDDTCEEEVTEQTLEKPEDEECEEDVTDEPLEKPEDDVCEEEVTEQTLEKPEDEECEEDVTDEPLEKPEDDECEEEVTEQTLEKPEDEECEEEVTEQTLEKPEDEECEEEVTEQTLEKPEDEECEEEVTEQTLEKPEDEECEEEVTEQTLEKPQDDECEAETSATDETLEKTDDNDDDDDDEDEPLSKSDDDDDDDDEDEPLSKSDDDDDDDDDEPLSKSDDDDDDDDDDDETLSKSDDDDDDDDDEPLSKSDDDDDDDDEDEPLSKSDDDDDDDDDDSRKKKSTLNFKKAVTKSKITRRNNNKRS